MNVQLETKKKYKVYALLLWNCHAITYMYYTVYTHVTHLYVCNNEKYLVNFDGIAQQKSLSQF